MSEFSIICAIEAGRLEGQTLLMLTTLKRFGGELGSCRIVAFQGRSGEKVGPATRQRLASLDVEYVFQPGLNRAPWFNYANKIAAVGFAQSEFDTPWRIWLDSDILWLDRPTFADPAVRANTDFHARFEYLAPAMTKQDTRFADYWSHVCRLSGLSFEEIGFCDLDLPSRHMKPYFNSGLFLWRAETGFAETYAHNFYRLLAARVAPKGIGPWFADQVSLTPTVAALDLRWQMLSAEDHLMMFPNALENQAMVDVMPRANLVHYSKSRDIPYRATLDRLVLVRRPELEDILTEHDMFAAQGHVGPVTRLRKATRRLQQALYVRRCQDL